MRFTAHQYELLSDLFVNLSAGFFGAIFIFPGIFGFRSLAELATLLFFNIPFGILSLVVASRLKEQVYA